MDLIAGHVPFGSVTFSSAAELIRTGKVRPLAVSAEKRLANFPDIPTFWELGYEDLVTATWFGFRARPSCRPTSLRRSAARSLRSCSGQRCRSAWRRTRSRPD